MVEIFRVELKGMKSYRRRFIETMSLIVLTVGLPAGIGFMLGAAANNPALGLAGGLTIGILFLTAILEKEPERV